MTLPLNAKIDPKTGEILYPRDLRLDELGRENPDPRPLAPPLGHVKQDSLQDLMRQMIVSHQLAQEAAAVGAETFEEADDFDIGDDYDPTSPYEQEFEGGLLPDPEPSSSESPSEAAAAASPAQPESPSSEPGTPAS